MLRAAYRSELFIKSMPVFFMHFISSGLLSAVRDLPITLHVGTVIVVPYVLRSDNRLTFTRTEKVVAQSGRNALDRKKLMKFIPSLFYLRSTNI
jgi:hypothetical protein